MKKTKLLFIIMLMIFPTIVYASNGFNSIPLPMAIFMEAFVSIHMSIFVLKPLSNLFGKEGSENKLFWTLFIIRIVILLFFDFFITPAIATLDFMAVFIGAFLVVPVCAGITKKNPYKVRMQIKNSAIPQNRINLNNIVLKCTQCGENLSVSQKFCGNCGAPFEGNNVKVEIGTNQNFVGFKNDALSSSNFDKMYSLSEDKMLEDFIDRELSRVRIDKNSNLIPSDILRKKKILNSIFSILLFVFVSMIFFHFPIVTYIIGLIILFIFYKLTRNYDLIKYLKKQVKARPSEKVSNIVLTVKNTFVTDDSKNLFITCVLLAVILPLIIFKSPRIFYEKVDDGYAVRYYTFGLTNFKTATIPESYNDEKVVSLRGNTFSNMFFLEEVTLPNTITEIRGQAFKNDYKLTKVKLPESLEYLGGGAFYNCKSLTTIDIPKTVTYIGGETFYNCKSLTEIELPENISEIRGDTFKNCSSLTSISIPDSVTRIGAHAFYGNSSLSQVIFSGNSLLKEIGSSAFRVCNSLHNVNLPSGVSINERAFKESPTTITYFNDNSLNSDLYDDNYFDNNYNNNVSKEYTLYLNQTQFINSELSLKLVSFIDTVHNEDIFVGKSGRIEIITKNQTYYFDFQTSSPQVFQYSFENYTLEVKSGLDNHIKIKLK